MGTLSKQKNNQITIRILIVNKTTHSKEAITYVVVLTFSTFSSFQHVFFKKKYKRERKKRSSISEQEDKEK